MPLAAAPFVRSLQVFSSAVLDLAGLGPLAVLPYCVAQASSTAWQQYRMQACAAPAVQDSAAYNKSCCRVSISNAQRRNDVERMLMQAMGVAWCAAAAERHEARHAPARFGLVVFARPDLVWWQPFKPWCSWPSHVVLSCEAPGCDAAG